MYLFFPACFKFNKTRTFVKDFVCLYEAYIAIQMDKGLEIHFIVPVLEIFGIF